MNNDTNIIKNVRIELEFKTRKKICVGAGGLPLKTIADINFIRLDDELIIPASTIKGVLRTCMIKVSKLLGYNTKPFVYPTKITDNDDIVTKLMGKPNKMGKIRVYNALIKDTHTFSLSHVRIDDKKGTAVERGLFSIEYIREGTTFNSVIEAIDIDNNELKVLLAALLEMNNSRIGKSGMVYTRIKSIEPKEELSKLMSDEIIKILMGSLMGDRNEDI